MFGEKHMTETDYFGRVNRLEKNEQKPWFRATPGTHEMTFLSEGTPYEVEWEGETVQRLRFDITANGENYSLGVTEGKTTASFYGQLLLIATKVEPIGKLEGKTIHLKIQGTGTNKQFIVKEAIDLDSESLIEREVTM